MTRDDDPTQPLPAADQSTVPIDAVEPLKQGRGASVALAVVVGIAAVAFVGAVLASMFTPGGLPVPDPSGSSTPSPVVTVAIDPDSDPGTPSNPPYPPAVEPTAEPTATDVPTPEPTPEPTPSQTR